MGDIERTNEKYSRAFVKSIRLADREAPEKYVRNLAELFEYLDEDATMTDRLFDTPDGKKEAL